ncbi:transposase [Streptomyces sp. NPDC002553]|uniref:transposase n=1 Tax=Streptomyces sp. NPDC002553 TaxID=3154417 RepID=UPI0033323B10
MTAQIVGRFARVEPRRRFGRLVLGLLSDLPCKNCWTIAEWAGESTPDGMQYLLGRAKWDADQVRDDVRACVVEHLRDDQAVLVVDLTGEHRPQAGLTGWRPSGCGTGNQRSWRGCRSVPWNTNGGGGPGSRPGRAGSSRGSRTS